MTCKQKDQKLERQSMHKNRLRNRKLRKGIRNRARDWKKRGFRGLIFHQVLIVENDMLRFCQMVCYSGGKQGHISSKCHNPLGICYTCNEPEHVNADRPKIPQNRKSLLGFRAPLLLESGSNGTLVINSFPVYGLFDSWICRSFVSCDFCKKFANPFE